MLSIFFHKGFNMIAYLAILFYVSWFGAFVADRDPRGMRKRPWNFLLHWGLCGYLLILFSYLFLLVTGEDIHSTLLKTSAYSMDEASLFCLWAVLLAILSLCLGLAIRFWDKPRSFTSVLRFSPRHRKLLGWTFTIFPFLFAATFSLSIYGRSSLMITEVCTGSGTYANEYGLYGDYIELYNPLPFPVDTGSLSLTDDLEAFPTPIQSPSKVPARGYAIVWPNSGSGGFGLGKDGDSVYLLSGSQLLDSVTVPSLTQGNVYARNAETLAWEVHDPSPMAPSAAYRKADIPLSFSAEAGFYQEPFDLTLTAPEGCQIYYTLDSSNPDETSIPYTGPIQVKNVCDAPNVYRMTQRVVRDWKEYTPDDTHVDKAFVIRAIAIHENGSRSEIVTKSYFVDMPQYQDKMVLSLVSDPEGLFGPDGIYVTGVEYDTLYEKGEDNLPTANFSKHGMENEVEGHAELFQQDELLLSQPVGLRLQGASTRFLPLKRFIVYSRPRFSGSRYFDYDLFGKDTHSFFTRENYTDVIAHELVIDTNVGGMATIPAHVFLDGEYWYTVYLRERYDEDFIGQKFSVDPDTIEIAKKIPQEIYDFIEGMYFGAEESYEGLNEIMDIQSYIEFLAANIYMNNLDTMEYKNLRMWRTNGYSGLDGFGDGRWRFLIYDLDALSWNGPGYYGMDAYAVDSFSHPRVYSPEESYNTDTVYAALKESDIFCKNFVLTFMDMANTCFEKEQVAKILASYGRERTWNDSFFEYRFDYIVPCLAKEFDLQGTLEEITLSVNQPGSGSIHINSVTPELENGHWSGKYYTDYPVTITAQPEEGYEFVAWHQGSETDTSQQLEVQLRPGTNTWEAEFRKIGDLP